MAEIIAEGIEGYKPGDECSICKGRCCRERGCALSPKDLTDEELAALTDADSAYIMLSGEGNGYITGERLYTIDVTHTFEGKMYYLRMRTKCYTFVGVEGFGECVALTDAGCSLNYEKRPKGGRMLKSSRDYHCHQEYGVDEMRADWEPYQEVLGSIFEKYSVVFEEDGTIEKCEQEYEKMMRAAWLSHKNGSDRQ